TESEMDLPDTPLIFTKFNSSIISATDPVKIQVELTQEVDYEVELGVVISKKAKNIPPEDALDHVYDYTVINDISARDLQFSDEQWVRGKSLDTFCPMGPVIATADEISDPQNLDLQCGINGETLQDDNTKNMIFGVADLISSLSHSFTLEAGDIIASGTPEGVGFSRKPPIYLPPGDTMRTWIEGIGEVNNPITKQESQAFIYMDLGLTNKVIIVTGGGGKTGSIGEVTVRRIAAEGGIPVIVDKHPRGKKLQEELTGLGKEAYFIQA